MTGKAKPLAGIRVLELARILAGPFLCQILADLGAEVVKVENPSGDDTRTWGPPFVGSDDDDSKTAAYFHACNRGKVSLTADFTNPSDLEKVKTLANRADIVVENFKVGGLKKFGLDYKNIHQHNPAVIYCSITGFGQTGPYAARAGYDYIIQAMSGFMDITGARSGEPQKIGVALADIITALYGATAVTTALYHRAQTGAGQYIDMALFDSMVGVLANQASNYFASGVVPTRLGNIHPNIAPYQVFYCAGRQPFVLACGNDMQFQKLMEYLGHGDVARDKQFASNAARVKNRDGLIEILSPLFATIERNILLQGLENIGVPAGPINTVAEALADPQIIARAMQLNLPIGNMGDKAGGADDGSAGGKMGNSSAGGKMGDGSAGARTMDYLRTPIVFSDLDLALDHPAPPLDKKNKEQNWEEVLKKWTK